jgi:hypothetical protein
MAATSFEVIRRRIEEHQGEDFRTVTGVTFRYHVVGSVVRTDRTNRNLPFSTFEKALPFMSNLRGPGPLRDKVQGSAYVFAILADPRIGGAE